MSNLAFLPFIQSLIQRLNLSNSFNEAIQETSSKVVSQKKSIDDFSELFSGIQNTVQACQLILKEQQLQSLEIFIEVSSFCEANQLNALLELLELHYGFPTLNLYFKNTEFNHIEDSEIAEILNRFYPWIIENLKKADCIDLALHIDNAFFQVKNNTLTLLVDAESYSLLGEKQRQKLYRFFKQRLGFAKAFSIQSKKNVNNKSEEAQKILQSLYASAFEKDKNTNRKQVTQKESFTSNNIVNDGSDTHYNSEISKDQKYGRLSDSTSLRYCKVGVDGVVFGKLPRNLKAIPIKDFTIEAPNCLIQGQVNDFETRLVRQGETQFFKFNLYSEAGSIACVLFQKTQKAESLLQTLKNGIWVEAFVEANLKDGFEFSAKILGLRLIDAPPKRQDTATRKRVELHCHSKMSARDGCADPEAIVQLAASMGHSAVAITDHGVVQAYPAIFEEVSRQNKNGNAIKAIYGMEGYLIDDGPCVCFGPEPILNLDKTFIAFDLETTGLDASKDRIIEIAAQKYERNSAGFFEATESFQTLVNPGFPLPEKIAKITGITDMDLMASESIDTILPRFHAFLGDAPLVAHNGLFDLGFLRYEAYRIAKEEEAKLKFNPVLIDTLEMARVFLRSEGLYSYKLGNLCSHFSIPLENAHRALDDARACGALFLRLVSRIGTDDPMLLNEKAGKLSIDAIKSSKNRPYHIVFLSKDYLGQYNIYRLVSTSHIDYFSRRPRLPKSLVRYFSSGILLGSACEAGEIYQKILKLWIERAGNIQSIESEFNSFEFKSLVRFYDYLEIQPIENNQFLLRKDGNFINSEKDLQEINRLIVKLALAHNKPYVATCDSHFLEPSQAHVRSLLLDHLGFQDADYEQPLYFRTTNEMLACFSYLGQEIAEKAVIDNTIKIAEQIQAGMRPFPKGSFPPRIDRADDDVREMTWKKAEDWYAFQGEIPEIVKARVNRELDAIISNGYAIMYYIASKLVCQSNADGYPVGSRGSVGSSLVATFTDITEVNPLPPHYRCPSCAYSEFTDPKAFASGYDLPDKACPHCQTMMIKDGQDIPFETFLGFKGDKQPDIDLNFSGDYQAKAHEFIREMFGDAYTFRAGTISSYQDKIALSIVKKWYEKRSKPLNRAESMRLASLLSGVKSTTGQHPGGIVVIPKDREIYDFTPIQYPADNTDASMYTTHFDFRSLHDTILKLDILGHDDPTMLKRMCDLAKLQVTDVPVPDSKVMNLFQTTEALGIKESVSEADGASLGLTELGTMMARSMIKETKPSHFYDLVQLMGLSHGTDVWKGNAQELIREGTCTINEVIGCRDSIMTTLIQYELPNKEAFDIMEKVRKGKGLSESQEELMKSCNVPDWYIDSCKKIKYMFPKAHAAAYSLSTLRIAWFKVYHPAYFYATWFTVKAKEFDANLMCQPITMLSSERRSWAESFRELDVKKTKQFYIIELIEEMYHRGISFLPIDLMKSQAGVFVVEDPTHIRPPLDAIPNFSIAMATALVNARESDGPFKSREDLMQRANLGKSALEHLDTQNVLKDLPESAQIDFFHMMHS